MESLSLAIGKISKMDFKEHGKYFSMNDGARDHKSEMRPYYLIKVGL